MSDAGTNVNATLRSMAYDEPVMILPHGGGRIGPVRVVQRIATQDTRNGTSVAVVLDNGQRIHLGDVERVRLLDEHDQAPAPPKAGRP